MNSPLQAETSHTGPAFSVRDWVLRFVVFAGLSGLGAFGDLYSKHLVFSELGYPNGQSEEFLDSWVMFRFHTSFNRGALWGIGQNLTWLFALLSLLAVFMILYWLFVRLAARSWVLTLCLASIMSGTLGNLYDRLGWHGLMDPITREPIFAVRDFLLFRFGTYNWPVFNIADVLLVLGAGFLIVHSLFGNMKTEPAP
jgi:signal peptidase II